MLTQMQTSLAWDVLCIYVFRVLHRFQHCTGHITKGSLVQLVKFLYCELPSNGKQLPAFPLEVGPGTEPRSQMWERECYHSATVSPVY